MQQTKVPTDKIDTIHHLFEKEKFKTALSASGKLQILPSGKCIQRLGSNEQEFTKYQGVDGVVVFDILHNAQISNKLVAYGFSHFVEHAQALGESFVTNIPFNNGTDAFARFAMGRIPLSEANAQFLGEVGKTQNYQNLMLAYYAAQNCAVNADFRVREAQAFQPKVQQQKQ